MGWLTLVGISLLACSAAHRAGKREGSRKGYGVGKDRARVWRHYLVDR